MTPFSLPKGFLWGVSTSAYQIEGAWNEDGKGPSIWDTFSHAPGKITNGDTGDMACDHYHRWPEDLQLMRDMGVNAYRFSISWPRVLPEGSRRAGINPAGLDFYDRLVDALLAAGIEPFPTLYHWDLPQALQDQGGWPERSTVGAFVDYAELMGRRLGDRVRWWITHNEPYVAAFMGHYMGEHAPGLTDARTALQAAHHLLLSHGAAVGALRSAAPRPIKVGIALNLQPIYPTSSSEEDHKAVRRYDGWVNRWFLEPLFKAEYPADMTDLWGTRTPRLESSDLACIAAPLDFLGVNYYSRLVVRHDPSEPLLHAVPVKPTAGEFSLLWEIFPSGLAEILERVWRDYRPTAMLVTENGVPCADAPDEQGRINDADRITFLERHLAGVEEAIARQVPVCGYFVWSLLDNFEWAYGYQMRFGLIYVDFRSGRRIPKQSARWYSQRCGNAKI